MYHIHGPTLEIRLHTMDSGLDSTNSIGLDVDDDAVLQSFLINDPPSSQPLSTSLSIHQSGTRPLLHLPFDTSSSSLPHLASAQMPVRKTAILPRVTSHCNLSLAVIPVTVTATASSNTFSTLPTTCAATNATRINSSAHAIVVNNSRSLATTTESTTASSALPDRLTHRLLPILPAPFPTVSVSQNPRSVIAMPRPIRREAVGALPGTVATNHLTR
ncbi:unnamed protein product, partial [Protopolystoma xenopodis]